MDSAVWIVISVGGLLLAGAGWWIAGTYVALGRAVDWNLDEIADELPRALRLGLWLVVAGEAVVAWAGWWGGW